MADQDPPQPIDDENAARLLAAAEAVIAAEDERIDAEEDRALLAQADEVRGQVHNVITRAGETRALRDGKHLGAGSRELLEWLHDEMQQLAGVFGLEAR